MRSLSHRLEGGGAVLEASQRTPDIVRSAIVAVASERTEELDRLDPDVDLWSVLDLDSLDHLAVVTRLAEGLGVDIPERDYPRLLSLRQLRAYVDSYIACSVRTAILAKPTISTEAPT
jgi:acyl carrier protein